MGDSPMYGLYVYLHATDTRVGEISLRFGTTKTVEKYDGNVGFGIDKRFRGNRYAEKACLIIRELAREHGLHELFFTCAPDNGASIKTCRRLGAEDLGLVELPTAYRMKQGLEETHYRRFVWQISVDKPGTESAQK